MFESFGISSGAGFLLRLMKTFHLRNIVWREGKLVETKIFLSCTIISSKCFSPFFIFISDVEI